MDADEGRVLCNDLLKLDPDARLRYIDRLGDNAKHSLINSIIAEAHSRDRLNGLIPGLLEAESKAREEVDAMEKD